MRLTEELAHWVTRDAGDVEIAPVPEGRRWATEEDHVALAREMLEARPADQEEIWAFAYGSLIWKPEFAFAERRTGIAHGWHRKFCLGWDHRFRGSVGRPSLMLALDRGGSCEGVAYRLPPDALWENLLALMRREGRLRPHAFPPRWIRLRTADGPIRAICFVMDRQSPLYVDGLSLEEVADVLAVAVGERGSMAEYLHYTVAHLEELGIHDRQLWRLQDMVAERIEAAKAAKTARGS